MNPIEALQIHTQSMVRKLFLHYKLSKAMFLMYLLVELVTLGLISLAYINLWINPVYAFVAYIALSAVYTFFFFMSFSYFLYNIVRQRPRMREPKFYYR